MGAMMLRSSVSFLLALLLCSVMSKLVGHLPTDITAECLPSRSSGSRHTEKFFISSALSQRQLLMAAQNSKL